MIELFTKHKFNKTWGSEKHNFLVGINKMLTVCSTTFIQTSLNLELEVSIIIWTTVRLWKLVQEMPKFIYKHNKIRSMYVHTSFSAPSLHPCCSSTTPNLAELWWHFVMTTTVPQPVWAGYRYFTVPKHHTTVTTLFFSKTTIPEILWVSTNNSEPLMQWSDTFKNDACNKIWHCLYGQYFGIRRTEW